MACLGVVPTLLIYGKGYNLLSSKGVCFLLSDRLTLFMGVFPPYPKRSPSP